MKRNCLPEETTVVFHLGKNRTLLYSAAIERDVPRALQAPSGPSTQEYGGASWKGKRSGAGSGRPFW